MKAMKDSGIEWIGEIPEGWSVKRLRYLGVFSSSGVDKKINEGEELYRSVHYMDVYRNSLHEITNSEDYLVVSANDNQMKNCTLEEGDILLTNSSETPDDIGHSVAVSEKLDNTLFGYHLMRFRPKTDLNFHFLKYALGSHYIRNWFSYRAYGMTRYGISYIDFAEARLTFPRQDHQERIASFLDKKCMEIEKIIWQQQLAIEKLKEYKQSVITEAVTKGLDPNVPMKDSDIKWIGYIPVHWDNTRLGRYITNTMNGLTRRGDDASDRGAIVLRIKEISDGVIDYSEPNRIALTQKEKETYTLHEEELLFVRVNGSQSLVGKSAVFYPIDEPVAFNDHIIKVTVNECILVEYIQMYLQSDAGKQEIGKHINTAAGQYTISGNGLRSINIAVPSIDEQRQIVYFCSQKIKGISLQISMRQILIDCINEYKKSLIYEAVTGKLEV